MLIESTSILNNNLFLSSVSNTAPANKTIKLINYIKTHFLNTSYFRDTIPEIFQEISSNINDENAIELIIKNLFKVYLDCKDPNVKIEIEEKLGKGSFDKCFKTLFCALEYIGCFYEENKSCPNKYVKKIINEEMLIKCYEALKNLKNIENGYTIGTSHDVNEINDLKTLCELKLNNKFKNNENSFLTLGNTDKYSFFQRITSWEGLGTIIQAGGVESSEFISVTHPRLILGLGSVLTMGGFGLSTVSKTGVGYNLKLYEKLFLDMYEKATSYNNHLKISDQTKIEFNSILDTKFYFTISLNCIAEILYISSISKLLLSGYSLIITQVKLPLQKNGEKFNSNTNTINSIDVEISEINAAVLEETKNDGRSSVLRPSSTTILPVSTVVFVLSGADCDKLFNELYQSEENLTYAKLIDEIDKCSKMGVSENNIMNHARNIEQIAKNKEFCLNYLRRQVVPPNKSVLNKLGEWFYPTYSLSWATMLDLLFLKLEAPVVDPVAGLTEKEKFLKDLRNEDRNLINIFGSCYDGIKLPPVFSGIDGAVNYITKILSNSDWGDRIQGTQKFSEIIMAIYSSKFSKEQKLFLIEILEEQINLYDRGAFVAGTIRRDSQFRNSIIASLYTFSSIASYALSDLLGILKEVTILMTNGFAAMAFGILGYNRHSGLFWTASHNSKRFLTRNAAEYIKNTSSLSSDDLDCNEIKEYNKFLNFLQILKNKELDNNKIAELKIFIDYFVQIGMAEYVFEFNHKEIKNPSEFNPLKNNPLFDILNLLIKNQKMDVVDEILYKIYKNENNLKLAEIFEHFVKDKNYSVKEKINIKLNLPLDFTKINKFCFLSQDVLKGNSEIPENYFDDSYLVIDFYEEFTKLLLNLKNLKKTSLNFNETKNYDSIIKNYNKNILSFINYFDIKGVKEIVLNSSHINETCPLIEIVECFLDESVLKNVFESQTQKIDFVTLEKVTQDAYSFVAINFLSMNQNAEVEKISDELNLKIVKLKSQIIESNKQDLQNMMNIDVFKYFMTLGFKNVSTPQKTFLFSLQCVGLFKQMEENFVDINIINECKIIFSEVVEAAAVKKSSYLFSLNQQNLQTYRIRQVFVRFLINFTRGVASLYVKSSPLSAIAIGFRLAFLSSADFMMRKFAETLKYNMRVDVFGFSVKKAHRNYELVRSISDSKKVHAGEINKKISIQEALKKISALGENKTAEQIIEIYDECLTIQEKLTDDIKLSKIINVNILKHDVNLLLKLGVDQASAQNSLIRVQRLIILSRGIPINEKILLLHEVVCEGCFYGPLADILQTKGLYASGQFLIADFFLGFLTALCSNTHSLIRNIPFLSDYFQSFDESHNPVQNFSQHCVTYAVSFVLDLVTLTCWYHEIDVSLHGRPQSFRDSLKGLNELMLVLSRG